MFFFFFFPLTLSILDLGTALEQLSRVLHNDLVDVEGLEGDDAEASALRAEVTDLQRQVEVALTDQLGRHGTTTGKPEFKKNIY